MSRMLLLLLLGARTIKADEDIVLPPISTDPRLPEHLLIFLPGAKVPNHYYRATAEAIQQATSELRLHVVIPAIPGDLCILTCPSSAFCSPLKKIVDGAVAKSSFKGVSPKEDTFVAGHSLGSICANNMVAGYHYEYAGLMEFGGYVDQIGDTSLANYSIPVLTMAGELDGGGARPGKLAPYYQQFKDYAMQVGEEKALSEKPVQVLPGVDHSDFCPGFFVTAIKDIHSEVTQEVALASIGQGAGAFLHLNSQVSNDAKAKAMASMRNMLNFTDSMLDPYLKAFALEQGPLCAEAQRVIVGVDAEVSKKLKVVTKNVDFSKFEHSRSGYAKQPDGSLELTCTSAVEPFHGFGPADIHQAAKSVDCKMVDATRVAEQLGITTDDRADCRLANKWAVSMADSLLPARSRARYESKTRKIVFKPDTGTLWNIGPLFVKGSIGLKETSDGLEVSSLMVNSTIASMIFPGVHYCKLLSPALALEWMMTDGLKPFPYPALAGDEIIV